MVSDYRNIRLTSSNVAFDGLYFYTIDIATDTLIQKTDDGTVAFSYPLNRNVTQPIISLCYEGINNDYTNGPKTYVADEYDGDPPIETTVLPPTGMAFWTLESDGANGIKIRRYLINNFTAKETLTYTIPTNTVGGGTGTGDVWNVKQMVLEVYETKLWEKGSSGTLIPGGEQIGDDIILLHDNLTNVGADGLDLFGDDEEAIPALPTTPDSGAILPLSDNHIENEALLKRFKYDNGDEIIKANMKLVIGPSTRAGYEGQFETVSVYQDIVAEDHLVINEGTIVGNGPATGYNVYSSAYNRVLEVKLSAPLTVAFSRGDPVRFVKNIFLFNQNGNNARVPGDGTNTGALYVFRGYTPSPSFALYKGGADGPLFYNVEGATFSQRDRKIIYTKATNNLFLEPNTNDLKFVKTGLMDNYDNTSAVPIPIFGLIATFTGELLRIQLKQEFNGAMQTWGTYNYVSSPLFSIVTSISVRPTPQIISADGGTDISVVTITVRDQYNQPIQGITVVVGDDNTVGKLAQHGSPSLESGTISGTTDGNGQVIFDYHSGSDDTAVLLTATVTQLTS
jgi:hypothetical protein